MSIELTVKEAQSISSTEIARWTARIDRINYALDQDYGVTSGGWGDDGQLVYMLAEKYLKKPGWKQDKDYEDAVLYEMKPSVNYAHVEQAFLAPQLYEKATRVSRRESEIGHIALREGLKRCGVLLGEPDNPTGGTVPPAVLAALCLRRADINQPVDRALYDFKPEIEQVIMELKTACPPRGLTSNEPGFEDYHESVYRASSYATDALLQKLGAASRRGAWWQELERDLCLMDEAAAGI